jgi:Ran GTPase-activating protein 1
MHTLVLEGNTLGIDAAAAIGESLSQRPTLRRALFKDLFTGRLKTEVPQALKHLLNGIAESGASLEELDLSDNAFGPIGARELRPFLLSEASKRLQVLLLNNNGLGIQGGTLLSEALPNLQQLKVLVCGRNRLENDASILIGNSLSKLTTLIELEMPQNGIRAEGIASLSQAIRMNEGLKVLNLNDNIITRKGAVPLGAALATCISLRIVNLGDCLLRTAGGVRILRGITAGKPVELTELMLNGNELAGDEIVQLVSQLTSRIGCHPSLKVDLSCNNFGSLTSKLEKIDNATIIIEYVCLLFIPDFV